MSKMISLRLPGELAEWAENYARERGVSRSELIAMAVRSFMVDCQGGVPDVQPEPEAKEPELPPIKRASDFVTGPADYTAVMGARHARLSKEMGWNKG